MINRVSLQNFTNFQDNILEFSPGINILIGKNGTGKTHILKSLAATIHANNSFLSGHRESKEYRSNLIADKLIGYFRPDQLGNLVRKGGMPEKSEALISIEVQERKLSYKFNAITKSNIQLINNGKWDYISSIYIPPREMLSLFEGFIGLTEKREISFDDTYISLAKALNLPLLKENNRNPLQTAIKILEDELHFQVIQENGRFYIKDEYRKLEAHLVAEGFRKIATVMYLILNGELKKDSVLFWDEPESNLNPALISVVARFILELSRCGVQVFIASHDYLLTHLLSLYAEYRKQKQTPKMKFFGLSQDKDIISIEEGPDLSTIQNNPILDEYAAYYDLEQQFLGELS